LPASRPARHLEDVRDALQGDCVVAPEIARELNVEAILEGSAHLVGGRVRLSVQLIAARTDETLWADRHAIDSSGRARPAERAR
jgi:TolB-like protein